MFNIQKNLFHNSTLTLIKNNSSKFKTLIPRKIAILVNLLKTHYFTLQKTKIENSNHILNNIYDGICLLYTLFTRIYIHNNHILLCHKLFFKEIFFPIQSKSNKEIFNPMLQNHIKYTRK